MIRLLQFVENGTSNSAQLMYLLRVSRSTILVQPLLLFFISRALHRAATPSTANLSFISARCTTVLRTNVVRLTRRGRVVLTVCLLLAMWEQLRYHNLRLQLSILECHLRQPHRRRYLFRFIDLRDVFTAYYFQRILWKHELDSVMAAWEYCRGMKVKRKRWWIRNVIIRRRFGG